LRFHRDHFGRRNSTAAIALGQGPAKFAGQALLLVVTVVAGHAIEQGRATVFSPA
jgi:hypothetical protein